MLTSRAHPLVKLARSLQMAKARREHGLFLAEGRNAVSAALGAHWPMETLFAAPEEAEWARAANVEPQLVADDVLASMSEARTSPGVAALCRMPSPTPADWHAPEGLLLVLDGIADPGNVGMLLRAADCAGAGAVLLGEGCADPFSPKAVRAAAGSTFHLPLLMPSPRTPHDLRAALLEREIPIVAAVARAGQSGFEFAWPERCALVLGHETRGIAPELEREAARVTIPNYGRAESLNVAAAGAVLMFAWRQNGACDG